MSFTLVPTTLLGAVNELLTAIGTVPVNTLDAPGASDVAIAQDTVESISREVQSRGWWFNTFHNRSFTPSGGTVTIPPEVLGVRPSLGTTSVAPESKRVVLRDGRLYDVTGNTFTINTSVRCDVVELLDFEHLPESVRRYITVRAARVFQTKTLGDDQLGVFTESHEQEAWQILEESAAVSAPHSMFFMNRVRQMGRMMRPDPVTPSAERRGGRR